ncbi:MAG TPA: extracellular solute-binding protein [Candidatus Limnocylindria bacterium]|nr:extracellular solute-binding protein [Candidatus Limnocylindria bacterium]
MRRVCGSLARALRWAGMAGWALLLACAPAAREKTVVFWQFWPADVVTPLIRKFESEHPGIKVQMEQLTWDSGKDKITAAVAAGKPPDLCELGSTYMPRFLASGALSDWSAGVADLEPGLRGWEMCSIGDALYGLPWVLGTRALFYNRTLFARAGLDSTRPPVTWGELRHAARAIQRLGGGVHGYGVSLNDRQKLFKKFMPFAWSNGGEILSADLDSVLFDSPENREALDFYLGLREVGMTGLQDALDHEFKEGRLGLQISGAWLCKQIPKEAPGLRYGVALVPMPATDRGSHASFAGGEVLVSFQGSRHKEEALKLARYLVRADNALALAVAAQSVQPATVGADTAAFYRERPEQQVMIRQFETARFTPNHPEWDAMEAAIEDEIEQALYDRKSSTQALADARTKLVALLGKP